MKYEHILFDLDGTLTKSDEGIINAIIYSLKKMGKAVPERSVLSKFIGPALLESYQVFLGFTREETVEALVHYREYYGDKGLYENIPYEGICDVLETLRKRGRKLYVATAKPEHFALQILNHFGLAKYFEYIAGTPVQETTISKGEVIQKVLNRYPIVPETALMVGDRKHDIIGAQENHMDSLGVLYGYGSEEELAGVNATFLAPTVAHIVQYVVKE